MIKKTAMQSQYRVGVQIMVEKPDTHIYRSSLAAYYYLAIFVALDKSTFRVLDVAI